MSRIEQLDKNNLDEFLTADAAVLILAKTTCERCSTWAAELDEAGDDFHPGVRIGKLFLDMPGLVKFKKANPWLAEVDALPYNVIYRAGIAHSSIA